MVHGGTRWYTVVYTSSSAPISLAYYIHVCTLRYVSCTLVCCTMHIFYFKKYFLNYFFGNLN